MSEQQKPGGNGVGIAAPDERTVHVAAPAATPVAVAVEPRPAKPTDGTVVYGKPNTGSVAAGTAPSGLAIGSMQATPQATTAAGATPSPFRTEVSSQMVLPGPGVRVAQYELIRELGQGGMGTVYLARDTKLGRRVAVKFLQTNQPELAQRFLVEARATARCSHENIVIIYEVGEHGQTPYMVLEYLTGSPLQKLIEGGQKLPLGRSVELISQVCRALIVAHEQGIVHRDLKPDNIIVTEDGRVKVLDFGIAKVLQEKNADRASAAEIQLPTPQQMMQHERSNQTTETGLTRHGAIMGTMAYMSPEQWGIGGIEIDHRTDVWATGIMLFRLLAGRHPLHPLRGQQLVITAMLDQPMPSIKEAVPGLPSGLVDVVDRCLRKKKEERFDSVKDLLRALEPFSGSRFTREIQVDQSPYAGLASFQENDAARFFGRTREIAAMVNKIRTQPMLAVVGSSGVGKSSLVRAGLVPALKRSGENWDCIVLRPGRSPMTALSAILNPLMQTSATIADEVERQAKLINRLKAEPGYLGATMRALASKENKRVLLFIDQFEELYTNVADPEERLAFTRCLIGAADDPTAPVRIVLSVRADFLDRVAEHPQFLAELNQGLFFVLPPNRDGLRDALTQPAEMSGYHFEDPAMVEDMLDHLAQTPGALPLLQFTASKLWDSRDASRKLFTQASYRELGGIAGALASHADNVLSKLTPQAQAVVRSIFLRLVTPERTRAVVSMKELEELSQDQTEIKRIVEQLAYARLVVVQSSEGGGVSTVEIVHESLIHGWPTLKKWLDEGHEDAVFMEQLRQAARQWTQRGNDAGLLWRGETVSEARKFKARYRGQLPWQQEAFLRAVFEADDKGKRRGRLLAVGGIVFAGALLAAAAVALFFINDARGKAEGALGDAKTAEQKAKVAEKEALDAKAQAEKNLQETITKEQERQAAEDQAHAAEREKAKADAQVAQSADDLQKANAELLVALEDANSEKDKAKKEEKHAEDAERRAVDALDQAKAAQQQAEDAKGQVESLLAKEKERADRLQKQLKGQMIEDLN